MPDAYTRCRIVCAFTALTAIGACAAVAVTGSHRPVVLNQSLASGLVLVLSAATAIVLAAGTFASERVWQRLVKHARHWRAQPMALTCERQFSLLLLTALVVQLVVLLRFAGWNEWPKDDQGDYLRVAIQVADNWGPVGIFSGLVRGQFLEANRHPLYVALLAISPTFTFGKILSMAGGLLVTLYTAILARRLYGPLAGGVAAILLATNFSLLHSGSLVACEALLTLLVLKCWQLVADRRHCDESGVGLLGLAVGLAYLTKASALFLLVVTAIWKLCDRSEPVARRARLVSYLVAAFVLTASPLLIRNLLAYDDPFYSFNTQFLFADSYDEGLAQPDLGLVQNGVRYFREHSPGEIIGVRWIGGLATEAFVIVRSLGPAPLDSGRAVFGAAFILLAVANMFAEPERAREHLLLAGWTMIFWMFFAWYTPIAASDRFVLPLVPPLLIAASAGVVRTTSFFFGEANAARDLTIAAVVYALAVTVMAIFWQGYADFFPQH